jgi:hypothetical protein
VSRIVLTCSCGASIDASWDSASAIMRADLTPPQLEQFRRDHLRCRDATANDSPPAGDAEETT